MKTRGAHSTGRGRLAAAFLFSLVVACAAFSFTADTGARAVIVGLAFVPFAVVWFAGRDIKF